MALIQKPEIPLRRPRIPVSAEERTEARAEMGGEQVKTVPATPEPAPKAATPDSVPATAPVVEAKPEPAPVISAPVTESVPVVTIAPAVAAERRKPGRKPAPVTDSKDMQLQSVHLHRATIQEIKLNLLLMPDSDDKPNTIREYIESALRLYEAQLRKQNKLPTRH